MRTGAARWALTAAFAWALASPGVPIAQVRASLPLAVGEGALISLQQPAATVFVANPEIADVQIAGPQSIFVFGQRTGRTTVFALDEQGAPLIQRDVVVSHDLAQLQRTLREQFPRSQIRVTSTTGAIVLEGSVDSPQEAEAIAAIAAGTVGEEETLVNRLTLSAPVQVHLRVRVAEVSRNIDQRLGVNWSAVFDVGNFTFGLFTGSGLINVGRGPGTAFGAVAGGFNAGSVDINVLIDALDREGLARTLAEPNLTAISGETASFTAGGEFPIPVAQDGDRTTIEFKQFGVILDFTPTVLSSDRISLRVRPEVSDLSNSGAIVVDSLQIPGLTVRRVDTTVELASGQSLVIGGLLQQSSRDSLDKLPGLGDLPVLGALFTSSSYQRNETELLVTVTPYIVRPTRPGALSGPVGQARTGDTLEALLRRRSTAAAETGRLHGAVGFSF